MPRLPQIVENQPLDVQPRSIGAAEAPGLAIAGAGEAVTEIGQQAAQKEIALRQARNAMDATTQGAVQASNLYDQVSNDPTIEPEDLTTNLTKGLQDIHNQIAKNIKDPKVALEFDRNFQDFTDTHMIAARALQRQREGDAFRASSSDALDNISKLSVDASGPELDKYVGLMHGIVNANVAAHYMTQEQGQELLKSTTENIYVAKYQKGIRQNPVQAFSDLQNDTNLEPVKKQALLDEAGKQIVAQQREARIAQQQAQEAADKAAKEATEKAVTQMTADALDGNLTHQELADANSKLNLSREDYEHLFDLINKPVQEPPSNPDALNNATHAVLSVNPSITQSQLWDMRLQGKLNLSDYTSLNKDLLASLKWQQDQTRTDLRGRQSQAEGVLRNQFGGDPAVLTLALTDMANGSAAQGGMADPLVLLPQIQKTYAPLMESLGGMSNAAVQNKFLTNMKAYESALELQSKWTLGIGGTIKSGLNFTNPYDKPVSDRKDELLQVARMAKKIGTPPPAGTPNGVHVFPDGTKAMVIDGEAIVLP